MSAAWVRKRNFGRPPLKETTACTFNIALNDKQHLVAKQSCNDYHLSSHYHPTRKITGSTISQFQWEYIYWRLWLLRLRATIIAPFLTVHYDMNHVLATYWSTAYEVLLTKTGCFCPTKYMSNYKNIKICFGQQIMKSMSMTMGFFYLHKWTPLLSSLHSTPKLLNSEQGSTVNCFVLLHGANHQISNNSQNWSEKTYN